MIAIGRKRGMGFALGMLVTALVVGIYGFERRESNNIAKENTYPAVYKVVSIPTPSHLEFAGEKTPLDLVDVREKLDRELHVNSYWHSNTFLIIKRANRWFPIIEPILKQHGIPDDFKYLAVVESGLTQAVSPAGARGMWQFMKSTGKSYGLEINSEIDERYHVEKSTEAACKYLTDAFMKYGSWSLVAASYNMGMSGLDKQMDKQKVQNYGDLLLNDETGRYVYRILAVKEILSNPEKFGFIVPESEKYLPYQTREIVVEGTVSDFASFAQEQGINYKILKIHNPWLLGNMLNNSAKKKYGIKVPAR